MTTIYLRKSLLLALMSFLSVFLFAQNYTEDAKKMYNIIKYANSVVALNDAYTASLANYQRIVSTADQNISNISQRNYQLNYIDCNSLQVDQSKIAQSQSEKNSVTSFTQKAELDRLVSQAENATQNIYYFCQQLDAYFAQAWYNQDANFSRYDELKNGFVNAVRHASMSWSNAAQSSVGAANTAEIAVLRYSKMADFVVPMKTDITAFKNILNQFSSGNDLNYYQIYQQINQLESSLNANKNLSGKNISKLPDSSYQRTYEDFYQNCLNGVYGLRMFAQQMEQQRNQYEIQNTYSQLQSSYSAAANAYNAFVR